MPYQGYHSERIAALERSLEATRARIEQLTARPARHAARRNPRLAVTTSLGTYPFRSDGYNAYEIRFVDATFTATAGVQAVAKTDRQTSDPFAVAHNTLAVPFVPDGQLLQVTWDNRRWWFEYPDEILLGELVTALNPGSSALVTWLIKSGGSFVAAPGATLTAWDRLGTFTGEPGDRVYFVWNRQAQEYWILNVAC